MSYEIVYSRQAKRDAKNLKQRHLKAQTIELLEILKIDPHQSPPRVEKLTGTLKGCYSRRINIKHRLVYEIFEDQKVVHILRMWTHYE